jgi:hypothetical protein
MATATQQGDPGPLATVTEPGDDNGGMALSDAERQQRRRDRKKAGETVPRCSTCGAQLQPALQRRPDRQGDGLCWSCWIKTPAGLEAERERGQRVRAADPEHVRRLARERARRWRQRVREQQQGQGAAAAGVTQGEQDGPEGG